MLINMLVKKSLSTKGICLCLKNLFSTMPYYREMAKKLNITIPKLNDQVLIENSQKCLVYGIKQISPQNFLENEEKQQKVKEKGFQYFDEESQLGFIIDKNSREKIQFNLAKRIATNLSLDICVLKQEEKNQSMQNAKLQDKQDENSTDCNFVLNLTKFRQYVYRQYYLRQLKNKSKKKYIERQLTNELLLDRSQWTPSTPGSYKNRIKSIRIGQDVHANDIKNKKAQVDRWIQQGQRTVKVIAHNASDKSFKALQKFCSLFQKQVEIAQEKVLQDPKKKPIIRLYTKLEFEEEIEVDFAFINKRWRRKEAEIKQTQEGKYKKTSVFDIDFTQEDAEMQRAYLAAFDQTGIPYPKQYNFLTELDNGLKKEGIMSLVRSVIQEKNAKIRQDSQQDQSQPLTQQQQKRRDKQNRSFMEIRTVEDIIDQMEEVKSREYEMEQFESSKYKQLENQLVEMLKNAKRHVSQRILP